MRAILIDDEELVLQNFRHVLNTYEDLEIIQTYANPLEVIADLQNNAITDIDVAFIDIIMPGMNGIELAGKMLSLSPDTEIIFVTADDSYTKEAFRLNALSYILKPVDKNVLDITLQRLRKIMPLEQHNSPHTDLLSTAPSIEISYLGKFSLKINGNNVTWRNRKCEELFVYLSVHCNTPQHKENLCDILWEHLDSKSALVNLHSTVYNVRKTFKDYNCHAISIIYKHDYYTLHIDEKNISFYSELIEAENLIASIGINKEASLETKGRLRDLYSHLRENTFLEKHGYLWAYEKATQLENRLKQTLHFLNMPSM